jgi:hypothetical protein
LWHIGRNTSHARSPPGDAQEVREEKKERTKNKKKGAEPARGRGAGQKKRERRQGKKGGPDPAMSKIAMQAQALSPIALRRSTTRGICMRIGWGNDT